MIIINYLLTFLIWILSILPFFILYAISDLLFFIFFYCFKYRKKVVFRNLKRSFPDKSEKEIRKIAVKFYHNLCDIIVEVVKTKTISKRNLLKRIQYSNLDIVDRLYKEGKSIMAVCGHNGNWEWVGMTMKEFINHKGYAVVKPMSSKFWEKYISKLRLRFPKTGLVSFKQIFRVLIKNKENTTFTLIAGDQTPTKTEIGYWTNFLNQDTALFSGIEKISKSLDMAVIFLNIKRVKRGFYNIEISVFTENPNSIAENGITEMHVRALEKAIVDNPDNWLWSHRRWKHKRE